MMKLISYGVRDLQAHLGRALDQAKQGHRVIIMSRGRPVAVLAKAVPELPRGSTVDRKLRKLAAEGRIYQGTGEPLAPRRVAALGAGLAAEVEAERSRLDRPFPPRPRSNGRRR